MSSDIALGVAVDPVPTEQQLKTTPIPTQPLDLDSLLGVYPALRQSLLGKFDDCALSTFFELRYTQGWSTHPQARGTIFHRFAAHCLREMKAHGEESIPVSEALQILYETLRQHDVPTDELVRVPLREIRDLRMAAVKFASDNSWDIGHVVDVERRLAATVRYMRRDPATGKPTGEVVERVITGALDALMADPQQRNGAIVLDWKDTWGLPPESRDGKDPDRDAPEDGKRVSYHGYFQQRFYAYLLMVNFPNVQRVTLREFYVRRSTPRRASVERQRLHHIAQELSTLVELFDRTFAWGPPPFHRGEEVDGRELRGYDLATIGPWEPTPGKHCHFCKKKGQCPIDDEARGEGAITSQAMAERYVGEMNVAGEVRGDRFEAAKAWVDANGPIPFKSAKGRMEFGWVPHKTGKGGQYKAYVPDTSDRGPHPADKELEGAVRESAARQRAARRKRPPSSGTKRAA